MLTLANLRATRKSTPLQYRHVSAILGNMPTSRIRDLENNDAEPWFTEAVALARIFNTGGILPLISSGGLTLSQIIDQAGDFPNENDLELWRSGHRAPLSLAMRITLRLGLDDPIELVSTPIQRQIWDILESTERLHRTSGGGSGLCPWCLADRAAGAVHAETCLPNNLWAVRGDLQSGRSVPTLQPQKRGDRARSAIGHGLKALRLARPGMRQSDIAAIIHCDANHYARVERGDSPLTQEIALKLAAYYLVDLATLYRRPAGDDS